MTEDERKLGAIDRIARGIKGAYKRLIARVIGSAKVGEVAQAVERGPDAVADLVPLGAMPEVTEAVRSAYVEGGSSQIIRDPRGIIITFNPADQVSANWIAGTAADIVTQARTDQLAAIFSVIQSGVRSGKTPNEIALDILGRVNRQTGQRVGGVIGLTGYDASLIMDVYDKLRTGDPEQLAEYLTRKDRVKLFDRLVKQAMTEEKAVPKGDALRIQAAYAQVKLDRHLNLVSEHNSHWAYNAGENAMYQMMMLGPRKPFEIRKTWVDKDDARVRPEHRAMHNKTVLFDQPFVLPSGARLMFPGDSRLGAGWAQLANCRCIARYKVIW